MLGYHRKLQEAGDTIVEVVVAVAVVSLVMVGAYGTTRNSVNSTEEAQERAQASKLAQTQLEYLRGDQGRLLNSSGKCYYLDAATGTLATGGPIPFGSIGQCSVEADGTTLAPADYEPAYNLSITKTATTYAVTVQWHGISSKVDSIVYYYRMD